VPMLCMGDEVWRTQQGNNNPYCHDSPLTWVNWRLDDEQRVMLEFVRTLAAFRKAHPALRRSVFLRGAPLPGARAKDIMWLRPDGAEMGPEDWAAPEQAALAFRLDSGGSDGGRATEGASPEGTRQDEALFVMMNGEHRPLRFTLPGRDFGSAWTIAIDTRDTPRIGDTAGPGAAVELEPGSLVVFVDGPSVAPLPSPASAW
jgi:isoamylase